MIGMSMAMYCQCEFCDTILDIGYDIQRSQKIEAMLFGDYQVCPKCNSPVIRTDKEWIDKVRLYQQKIASEQCSMCARLEKYGTLCRKHDRK